MKAKIWIVVFVAIIALIVGGTVYVTKKTGHISISGTEFDVIVADNWFNSMRGLSGIELDDLNADGMVFLYDSMAERIFWMKDMEFDLDVIWVSDGKIMKIDRNVPEPITGEEPAKMYSRPFEVDMVIEFPAGFIDNYDVYTGQTVLVN